MDDPRPANEEEPSHYRHYNDAFSLMADLALGPGQPEYYNDPRNVPDLEFDERLARNHVAALEALIGHADLLGYEFDRDQHGGRVPQDEIDELKGRLEFGPWPQRVYFPNPLMDKIVDQMFSSNKMLRYLLGKGESEHEHES